MNTLVSQVWNGTVITRRESDGYVNATAMCKANGKLWGHFCENSRTSEYLQALSENIGKPILGPDSLIQSRKGKGGGTWVHPDVATELARWISPEFSVFVNQWFRGEVEKRIAAPVKVEPIRVTAAEELEVVERAYNFLSRIGMADERDKVDFADLARNAVKKLGSVKALPENREMTVSEAWLKVAGTRLNRAEGMAIGKLLAKAYRSEFDQEPPTRSQYVDGAVREVKSYRADWILPRIEEIYNPVIESDH